jgi:transposase InsO family protein
MDTKSYDTKKRKEICDYHLVKKYSKVETCIEYEISRPTLDKWLERYDGKSRESLKNKSRRPKTHSNKCSDEEEQMVLDAWKENGYYGGDYVYGILRRNMGFKRHISTMYRILKKHNVKITKEKQKRENKPYITARYPGEKLQMDVKYVPKGSLSRDLVCEQWYQWTIIDEATGIRYLEWYKDKKAFNSCKFVLNAVKFFQFRLCMIQTDNGSEFVNKWTEKTLETLNIKHKRIRPATPRHNGKVERSHRVDGKFFYDGIVCESFEELVEKGKKWNEDYNNMYMRKFNYLSPNEVYKLYRQNPKKGIKKRNLKLEKLNQVA